MWLGKITKHWMTVRGFNMFTAIKFIEFQYHKNLLIRYEIKNYSLKLC